ncbi:glycoside hydrolase family 97 protein [Mucilaginibacter mallensis]|nr:glycoside hydrolase family 97 protein [Mucilaginibacter mallensis]
MNYIKILLFIVMICPSVSKSQTDPGLLSPDGKVRFQFSLHNVGGPGYQIFYHDQPVILASVDSGNNAGNMELVKVQRSRHHGSWRPVAGEQSIIHDNYNELILTLRKPDKQTDFQFIIRAYNEGIGLRYSFPDHVNSSDTAQLNAPLIDYKASFPALQFTEGTQGYCTDHAQGIYKLQPLKRLQPGITLPLTITLPGGIWACIANGGRSEFSTQWQAILIADEPNKLLENNFLISNLNEGGQLKDISWIKPGKVIREMTLSTKGAMDLIDFAVKQDIQFIEFDAGWYGPENKDSSDATRVNVDPERNPINDLDMQAVIRYAGSKNKGVILYVNHRALEKQQDTLFSLYEKWGIAGVKFGFVNTGTLYWDNWLYGAIKKTAAHHLMVDVHDEYSPTGYKRTYPNLITQEGVRGNEEFPDATHNTILPFTRFIAGPADYTFCFQDKRLKNTKCHQLALSVVYFSPWQFLYWYDRPQQYTDLSEVEFWKKLPTVWDQTKVPQGAPEQYIVVARKNKKEWYVGAITNDDPRSITIATDFLQRGKWYEAEIYEDGPGNSVLKRTEKINIESLLTFNLQKRGGVALRIYE